MITAIIPKLPFIDKVKTLSFYQKLGFVLDADYGDYCIISKDKTEIHLFSFPKLNPFQSDFMVYIRMNADIEKMYINFQENLIEIHPNGNLEKKPWNQIEFSILDPNGTLLTFGQSL
jgi:hypothetical protein